jgi:polynucleotide 5'-hydroxyl-kinase GRC3/NOL9
MSAGEVWMVKGPAAVYASGICSVLGMDVSQRKVEVRAGKALPFEPCEGCALDIRGESWPADSKSAGTQMWAQAAYKALRRNATVMVTGATDTGKSTFATYLANLAVARGLAASVIDGDIGQGDLAPPAALGACTAKKQATDLRDFRADLFEFVGTMTPAGAEGLVAEKLGSLVRRMSSGLKIVNTDGYDDPAYRRMLAGAVRPDVLVCMGAGDFSALAGPWELVEAPPSGQAAKTRAERVGRRLEQYMAYVGTGLVQKPMEKIRIRHQGRPVGWDRLLALSPAGMFVALGTKGVVSGFGVIESISGSAMEIRTDVRDFGTVHASDILLVGGREERITLQMQGL